MPFITNLNTSPYFNDFDSTKNYHQILFRPSTAVQARELTQLQSILQNQIEKFGNWAFKNGDIVQGCSVNDFPIVPYVFLSDSDAQSEGYDARAFVNCVAISPASNLQARIIFANVGFQANYPNCNIIYLSYLNTGKNGETLFSNNEMLNVYVSNSSGNTLVNNVYTMANVAGTNTTGNAHGISVSEGIVYLSGAFVDVTTPTFGLVNAYGTYAGNNVVGFTARESIVTENQDPSLHDNALGYDNYNAPGAHRLKVTPILTSLPPDVAATTKDFNPIVIYNYGSIITKTSNNDIYSVVEDAVAKRTYEESGNYVVNPFAIDTITNTGDATVSPSNNQYMFAKISPGVGYSQGSRVAIEKAAYINLRRGIDTRVDESAQITFNYGNYLILNEVAGAFEFDRAQTVNLYNQYQTAVTSRRFSSLTPAGTIIGTAKVRCFSYSGTGVPGTSGALYYLHVFDVKMNSGYNANQIRSVSYTNGSTKAVADIATPGLQNPSSKPLLFSFNVPAIKALRDSANNNNTEYVYRTKTASQLTTSGTITVTLSSSAQGGTDTIPYGVGTLTDMQAATISVTPTANTLSSSLSGTVAVSTTNTTVTGTSTSFVTNFAVGDVIYVGSDYRVVRNVTSATSLVVDAPFSSTASGQSYFKAYPAGKQIPISMNLTGAASNVTVTNTTSFTINLNVAPVAQVGVDVTYDVFRKNVAPAKKSINKGRLVRINANNNPTGPWCLGFTDVHRVVNVWGSSNGTYSTTNPNITNQFIFTTGQKDTHYEHGYLKLKPGMTALSSTNLLVELEYFASNTTPGVGFFTVESYPIDDANTASLTAIQTKDIPVYISEGGNVMPLRDFVDFRPVATLTANDAGYVNTSNSTAVAAMISSTTLNPANTVTFPTNIAYNVPSYGRNLSADYTVYLPRKDIVYITPDNKLKIKEGVSASTPQAPLHPDSGMVLGEIQITPYPSLTSDQIISLVALNKFSESIVRDVSSRVTVSSLTNRRYTMKDIGKLDSRITNLEYYTQLSMLEKMTKDLTVTDENGLDRFKNGIFVDPMSDFKLSDVSNPEFNICIDSERGLARPKIIREVIRLKFDNGSATKTGRCVTLPYTTTTFMEQRFATKYRAASHVAYAWNGNMILYPSLNHHVDIHQNGSINMTIDTARPWQDFAASPFAYNWGDWKITTDTDVRTVLTGQVNTYNYTIRYGYRNSAPPPLSRDDLYNIMIRNGVDPGSDWIVGSVTSRYSYSVQPGFETILNPISGTNWANPQQDFLNAVVIGWAMGWW